MRYQIRDEVPNLVITENFSDQHSLLTIEFWEAHIRGRSHVAEFLAEYAHDKDLAHVEDIPVGRIRYRFGAEAWLGTVQLYLIEQRIPVTIELEHSLV